MRESALVSSSAMRGRLAQESTSVHSSDGSQEAGANQIIAGDCLAVLPRFASESIHFVLTDPPYLANYHDRNGRSVVNDDNASWLDPAFSEIFRVLKSDCFCVSFYGWPKVDRFFIAWRKAAFRPIAT
jgi:site-specific DNA-methyltransferase (adenine-specific)